MRCPQCEFETPPDAWNCPQCRVNLYWAHRHGEALRAARGESAAAAPAFLKHSSRRAFDEPWRRRAPDNKVRELARRTFEIDGRAQPAPESTEGPL